MIDGDKLIDIITNSADLGGVWGQVLRAVKDAFIRLIRTMPNVNPEPHWIPCSERLPEELSEVNVTWINTDPEPYYDFIKGKRFTGSAIYYKGRWYWYSAVCADYLGEYGTSPNDIMDDAIKVIAWMPLPEPWRGDAE